MDQNRKTPWLLIGGVAVLVLGALFFFNRCSSPKIALEETQPVATGASAPSASLAIKVAKIERIEEGVVYSDDKGNTFQQERAGDRRCDFYVGGVLKKQEFVYGPDDKTTKKMCDIRAELFRQSMTPHPKK